jgi:hypothetical protein
MPRAARRSVSPPARHDAADLREAGADRVIESMEQPLPL